MGKWSENELSREIIGAAIEVHKEMGGPGLLEDMYEEAFEHELQLRGLKVKRQCGVKVTYKGKQLKKRLVLDLVVEDLVVVENKAVAIYLPIFEAQLATDAQKTWHHHQFWGRTRSPRCPSSRQRPH